LEKDAHALHKKHIDMSKVNIVEHIAKYKILEKMVRSPKWHCAQFYDMIAMLIHMVFLIYFSHFLWMKHLNSSGVTYLTWRHLKKILVKNLLRKFA